MKISLVLPIIGATLNMILVFLPMIKEEKKGATSIIFQLTRLGKIVLVLCILTLFINIYLTFKAESEGEEVREANTALAQNVDVLGTKQDSIASMLSSIDSATLESLATRQLEIEKFNENTRQLKEQNRIKTKEIITKGPLVQLESARTELSKNDTTKYQVYLTFANFGERFASDVEFSITALYLGTNGVIGSSETHNYDKDRKRDLPATKEMFLEVFRGPFSYPYTASKFRPLYFFVSYRYIDPMREKQIIEGSEVLFWRGFEVEGGKLNVGGADLKNMISNYMANKK